MVVASLRPPPFLPAGCRRHAKHARTTSLRDPVTKQITSDQKGTGGAQRGRERNIRGTPNHTKQNTRPQGENGSWNQKNAGENVHQNEHNRSPDAELVNPVQRVTQEFPNVEIAYRNEDRYRQC
jgi:hypothetical protein